jgi:hypothetical protein
MAWGDRRLSLGERTCVMGIVNITPDSFSDGGRYYDADGRHRPRAWQTGGKDGADVLDIGGESTRPFADPVDARSRKSKRVVPVIAALAGQRSMHPHFHRHHQSGGGTLTHWRPAPASSTTSRRCAWTPDMARAGRPQPASPSS